MQEIRIHGRGGQGVVIASEILAEAGFRCGRYVQAFPSFGSERRGAAVAAFVRLDEQPIFTRTEIYKPHGIIVLDEGLITLKLADVSSGLLPGGFVLVNSAGAPEKFSHLGSFRIGTVDASRIAVSHQLGSMTAPIVNTAILGAFVTLTGAITMESLEQAIREHVPFKPEENVQAAKDAAEMLRTLPTPQPVR